MLNKTYIKNYFRSRCIQNSQFQRRALTVQRVFATWRVKSTCRVLQQSCW